MNGKTRQTDRFGVILLATGLMAIGSAGAQVPVDEDGNPIATDVSPLDSGVEVENPMIEGGVVLTSADLEALVGPIALYPDDLLAIVLPAATYPLEIVQAARFLESAELDSSLKPDEEWDDSIIALLNYPDVLRKMNDDIDWTWKLGEAVVSQQNDVIGAIETFRDRAYAAGNLKTDERQVVSLDDGIIEIEPVEDDVIYVPYYEPAEVVVYSPRPVYHYYPRPYPVYYYPYPSNHYFASRYFWGVTTAFTIGWATDRLHVHHHSYSGHPYYGYTYYGPYWRRPSINVHNTYYVNPYRQPNYFPRYRYRDGDHWRPRHRSGPRPRARVTNSGYYRDNYDHRSNAVRRSGASGERARAERDRRRDAANNRSDRRRNATGNRALTTNANRARGANRPATTRDNSNRGQRQNPSATANQARTRSNVERDAIRFRPRGNGAYTGNRSNRARRADGPAASEAVRNRSTRPANVQNQVRNNRNRSTRASAAPRQEPRNVRPERRTSTRTTTNTRTTARSDGNRAANRARTNRAALQSTRVPRASAPTRPKPARRAAPPRNSGAAAKPSRPARVKSQPAPRRSESRGSGSRSGRAGSRRATN